jgi:hypothetical protein
MIFHPLSPHLFVDPPLLDNIEHFAAFRLFVALLTFKLHLPVPVNG